MNAWILYAKALLLSAGAVFLAMVIKSTVPVICTDVVLPWLKLPYLYILVNGIIITIAASSPLHRIQSEPQLESHDHRLFPVENPPPSDSTSFSFTTLEVDLTAAPSPEYEGGEVVVELKPVIVNGLKVLDVGDDSAAETLLPAAVRDQKPPIPSRSGHRRSTSHRSGPKTPTVVKHDTLDSIWKKITEGTSRATHEAPQEAGRMLAARPLPPQDRLVDHVTKPKSGKERRSKMHDSVRIRREPWLSQAELNSRVEAFIKKVNQEMRLEREISLDRTRRED